MVIVSNNWRMWMVGTAVSLIIFAVVFFTVIKPSSDTANQALKSGLQQSQQALNQAQKQLSTAGSQSSAAGTQAQTQLSRAAKLTACASAAGTDVTKLQACQARYAG